MTRLLILSFILFNLNLSGQEDSLNRLDSKGKKDGYWLQYLDSAAYPTDSANACFYGYNLYDHGQKVFMYSSRNKFYQKYKLIFEGNLPEKGKPKPIAGTFKWYYEKQILNEEIYKDGKPVFMKSYVYSKRDQINSAFNEVLYFDKLYNNVRGTFYYEEYDNGKLARTYWFYKGRKGWRSYRIKEN